jgi:hypothetical protein
VCTLAGAAKKTAPFLQTDLHSKRFSNHTASRTMLQPTNHYIIIIIITRVSISLHAVKACQPP